MPILGCKYWWYCSYTAVTTKANTTDIDTVSTTDTNTDNVVDANDADAAYTAVVDTTAAGTAGTVHQYAHSGVMGMNALHQQTGWWFEMYPSA